MQAGRKNLITKILIIIHKGDFYMKIYCAGAVAALLLSSLSITYQAYAHQTVDFKGTIGIKVENENFQENVHGTVSIAQWGHEETNGNFEEAIFNFEFGTETSSCGAALDAKSVRVSSYRENKFNTTSKAFPLDLSEDGMAIVLERILNKHGTTLQEALALDECFSITDGAGTAGDKMVFFSNAYIQKGKATIKKHFVKTTFKIEPKLKTYDDGFLNKKEYPLNVSGNLVIQRVHHH